MTFPVAIQQATVDHRNLIFSTWIKCALNQHRRIGEHVGQRVLPHVSSALFADGQHRLIEALLSRSHCIVATDPDDGDQVYGYLIGEPGRLHMVYTRADFRRLGVATRLLRALYPQLGEKELQITQATPALHHLAAKWKLTFNPFGVL